MKTKPRVFLPGKIALTKAHFQLLFETGAAYQNPQVVATSVAIAFTLGLGKGYGLVADLFPIKCRYDLVPRPMKNPEIEGNTCAGVVAFCPMYCL